MGQGQSRDEAGRGPRRTCYYETLELSVGATDAEIKKAYRKKALELHPDRNYGNTEDATRQFAEVQTAYEILSNPHERAWYDAHREEILHGVVPGSAEGSGNAAEHYEQNVRVTSAEDITRMYMGFDGHLKFDDSDDGFFTQLRKFFDRLALEEELAGNDPEQEPLPEYPTFGTSRADHITVVRPFYAVWSGFATRKSFAWKNMYRLSEAPDRRTRRYMEKENRKAREQGIRDFNAAVRALVSFVRRRDPRQTPGAGAASGDDLHTMLRKQAAEQAVKARKANQAAAEEYVAPEWAQGTEQQELEDDDSEEDREEEDEVMEVLECVVCKKTFKSESQYLAHEKSKKHQKAFKDLERKMRKENKAFGLDEVDITSGDATPDVQQEEEDYNKDEISKLAKPDESQLKADSANPSVKQPEPRLSDSDAAEALAAPRPASLSSGADSDAFENEADDSDEERSVNPVAARLAAQSLGGKDHDADAESNISTPPTETTSAQDETNATPKVGKAKQRRAHKEARAAVKEAQGQLCNVCKASFASKTKLFEHIKREGHARAEPAQAFAGKKKGR